MIWLSQLSRSQDGFVLHAMVPLWPMTPGRWAVQELDAEMHELMEWMHHIDSNSEDEDPLLALAEHAATPVTPAGAAPSQQVHATASAFIHIIQLCAANQARSKVPQALKGNGLSTFPRSPAQCWTMRAEGAGLLQPREQSRAELSELLQEGMSRRQSAYLSQAERERNDILEARQGEKFPSPPSHKLLRMASQLVPDADPAGQSPCCRCAQTPHACMAMPELSPVHQQGAESRLQHRTTSCETVPCSSAHAALGRTVLSVDTQNME